MDRHAFPSVCLIVTRMLLFTASECVMIIPVIHPQTVECKGS